MRVLLWNPGRQTNGGSNSVVAVVVRARSCAGGRNSGSTAPHRTNSEEKDTNKKTQPPTRRHIPAPEWSSA